MGERTIFIKEIIMVLTEPEYCPTCEKKDRLERGTIKEQRSNGKTILCSRCEALTVITNYNLKHVDLSATNNYTIMLKEPHLIRRVDY